MSGNKTRWSDLHKSLFEKNSLILTVGVLVTVSIGGIVEIAPLFYLDSTIEEVEGMRPYTPIWPGSAGAIRTSGIAITCAGPRPWCRNR